MKERPILMTAPQVRALREGKQTQKRRIVKPQPEKLFLGEGLWHHVKGGKWESGKPYRCPYGKPGDLLWVRETFAPTWHGHRLHLHYRADGIERFVKAPEGYRIPLNACGVGTFAPPIFMPRWASRLTLKIAEVRVQRLQEISEEDARAEGLDVSRMR